MKQSLYIRVITALIFVPLVYACQPSYKVSRDSYVFKTETHRPTETQSAVPTQSKAEDLNAQSIEPVVNKTASLSVSTDNDPVLESVDERIDRTKDAPEFVKDIAAGSKTREEAVEAFKNLSKKEKKEVKKWVKKEAKSYKKEVLKAEKADAVTRDMRTGIILGAVGLVLLLIAGGGVLGAIGAILFVVGLVFILLEVL
ncbi:hypothetical protein AB9P05_06170 [Roseivirga sp. BDSF3-8]|uniref:hypothetical protein n=1 Tax=Roseivirga sp. BDSF3-8 TaxID=3241598 RepID=UPI0035321988